MDNREPRIPDDLLSIAPGATAASIDLDSDAVANSEGASTVLLVVAVAVAFVAGAAVSGASFMARGRA
jgi:hypothetical protein